MNDVEFKGIVENLVQRFLRAINFPLINRLVREEVRKHYIEGIEDAELKLEMNFGKNEETIGFLETYTFDNIKGMSAEVAERLRKELQQGLLNNEAIDDLRKRVQKVTGVAEERARLIARTEMVRARNAGSLDAARQSGLVLKKVWSAAPGERTCPICNYLDGKKVGLDVNFRDREGNTYLQPPAHPRCRCSLIYEQA